MRCHDADVDVDADGDECGQARASVLFGIRLIKEDRDIVCVALCEFVETRNLCKCAVHPWLMSSLM